MDFVALDIEAIARTPTADSIPIEIGAVRFVDSRVEDAFKSFIDPGTGLPEAVTRLTGISDGDLDGAPTALSGYESLLEFVDGDPVVAHNGVGFDFQVLDRLADEMGRSRIAHTRFDTLYLAHLVFPKTNPDVGPTSRSLGALAAHLGIAFEGEAHRAVADARVAGHLFLELLAWLAEASPARELQRSLLLEASADWSSLFEVPSDIPRLEHVIPEVAHPSGRTPTGTFDPDVPVASLMPGGEHLKDGRVHRPQQTDMAQQIAKSFVSDTRAIIEAPTGVGKTLAYLAPSAAWARASGECILVAPHTKVLQDQVANTLSTFDDLTFTTLKGVGNYVDLNALQDLIDEDEKESDVAGALAVVVGWLAETRFGDWEDLESLALQNLREAFREVRERCSLDAHPGPAESELDRRCFYRAASAALDIVDVAVINQAVLTTREDLGTRSRRVVVDEAHELEDAATSAFSEELTARRVRALRRLVWNPKSRTGAIGRLVRATDLKASDASIRAVTDALSEAEAAEDAFGRAAREYVEELSGARREIIDRYGAEVRTNQASHLEYAARQELRRAGNELRNCLRGLARALDGVVVPSEVRRPYRRRRLEIDISKVGRLNRKWADLVDETVWATEPDDWISIVGIDAKEEGGDWTLKRVPLSVAPLLKMLWREFDSVVMTSATLTVNGSFDHFLERLGLGAATPQILASPFAEHRQNHRMILTDHLPAPRQDRIQEFTVAETSEIPKFIAAAGGRTLALFTARNRMRHVFEGAESTLRELGFDVALQGDGPSQLLLERMRDETRSSLLAVKSFWQGVDVPGEALSQLIIEKLPFESPSDPVVGARTELLELQGRDAFLDYIIPRAAVAFAQGVGRLIRSTDDVGVSVILDSRLRRPVSYRDTFLSRVEGVAEVERPETAMQAYQLVADHLGLRLDDGLLGAIDERTAPAVWSALSKLELRAEHLDDVELIESRLDQVREILGFESWRTEQVRAMADFIQGRDVFALLPTGSGKSVTFQIPALLLPGITVVVSPLVALIRDQVRQLGDAGIQMVAALYSGQAPSERAEVLRGASSGRYRLIYVSPERLWSPEFRAALKEVGVSRLVVDEAHCISQWGQSFRTEYSSIPDAIDAISGSQRPTVFAATATASPRVSGEIQESLRMDLVSGPIEANPDRPEVRYHIHRSENLEARDVDTLKMVEAFRGEPCIIYVPRKVDAARLSNLFRFAGHNAAAYHAGLPHERRKVVEERFLYGDVDVVVGTKAFGLGINKDNISLIVHYEMPASIEEFIQETGRLARGAIWGQEPAHGTSILISTPRDCRIHSFFIKSCAPDVDLVERVGEMLAEGVNHVVVEDMARLHKAEELQIELALFYLHGTGLVSLGVDRAWHAKINVPPDAAEVLRQVDVSDRKLARAIIRFGSMRGDYSASEWSKALGAPVETLEDLILELQRRDVLAFYPYSFARTVTRNSSASIDRGRIAKLVEERTALVRDLSNAAKAYARNWPGCRRKPLLEYLGADAPENCGACDHCTDLSRPWDQVEVTVASLYDTVPVLPAIERLVRNAGIYHFSEQNYINCLLGETGYKGRPLHDVLTNDPVFGAFRVFGRDVVIRSIQSAIDAGTIERFDAEFSGRSYTSLRIPKVDG